MEAAALFPVDDPIAEPPALPRPVIPSYGHPFSLFVSMPTAEVHRLRDLGSIVTCEEVREKLELVAGLPSDIYSLQWPDGTEFTEGQQLSFGQDTRDGAVIKAKVLDNWMELFMAICRNAKREVYRLIKDHPTRPQTKESRQQAEKAPMAQEGARQQTQQAPPPEVNSQPELGLTTPSEGEYVIFICLYLACHRGLFDMVKRILEQYGPCSHRTASFGRTIVHATVSRDHILLLHLLLQNGHDPSAKDVLGISPFGVAMDIGACACLRVLRGHITFGTPSSDQSTQKKLTNRQIKSAPGKMMSTHKKTSDSEYNFGKTHNVLAEVHTHLENARNKIRGGEERNTSTLSEAVMTEEVRATCIRSAYHNTCKKAKPFVAQRTVHPSEGKKLVTVEYNPLQAPHNTVKKATYKPPHSATARNPYKEMIEDTTKSTGHRRRSQSAKYYETKYHKLARQEEEYRPVPDNAGSRFRFWKSWLLEKLEEDEKKKEDPEEMTRKKMNDLAYRRWYKKKQKEGFPGDYESSDDEDNDFRPDQEAKEKAFREWLEKKKVIFAAKAKAKREKANVEQEMARNGPSKVYDRRVTVFEMTSTEPLPVRYENPNKYHTSYRRWRDRRLRFDAWKERQANENNESYATSTPSKESYERDRKTLLLQGITYEEWLGLKERQALVSC